MEFNSIGILITEDCNARCKMCCDSRGLVRGKTLSDKDLDIILGNVKECVTINDIGITGGEPMLYPQIIDKIFNYDFDRGVKFTLKTNGFWGNKTDKTEDFINRYKDKISKISLSYDDFHAEFIDVEYLKNIIGISKKYNIPTEVVACCLKSTSTPGDIINQFGESAYLTQFCYQPVINTGSAKLFNDNDYIKTLDINSDDIRCINSVTPTLLITPKLDVYPCCSQVIENTILNIGNLYECSLSDCIERIKHNYIFETIFSEGFKPFINYLKKQNEELLEEMSSPCEFCEFLFKDDWFIKKLSDDEYYENI